MTFRNWPMVLGLLAILVPVLIHLFSRRRAKRIDWGATLFLINSLRQRSRMVLIEEVLALVLRCLLVAVVALAMARPFLAAGSTRLWGFLLPALFLAAVFVGVGTAVRRRTAWRWALYGAAGVLLALCLLLSAGQRSAQMRRWTGAGGGQDIVVLVDTSYSMGLAPAAQPNTGPTGNGNRKVEDSNFQRSVDEVRKLVQARNPGDRVLLVSAGTFPEALTPEPTDRDDDLRAALDKLAPDAGGLDPAAALREAAERVKDSPNGLRTFVFFTDTQALGWHPEDETRWRAVTDLLRAYPQPPRLIFRTLPLPDRFNNVAVSGLQLTRNVVGTTRPAGIKVTVANTGTDRSVPFALRLDVGDGGVLEQPVGALEPGQSEPVRFRHQFTAPGPRPIRAFAPREDDLPADNSDALVVRVIERFPVLVIDGQPSARVLDSAAGFLRVALEPPVKTSAAARESPPLVDVETVAVTDVGETFDFSPYRVVVLADVPRLPGAAASSLARFVADGGGLLIAPGANAQRAFYNEWVAPDSNPVVGARLAERRVFPDKAPASVNVATLNHPALETVSDSSQSDIDRALFTVYWVLRPEGEPGASPAARFMTGEPFFVERPLGKGRVLTTAFALDARDSNFPALSCFVPFVHELVYYTAGVDAGSVSIAAHARRTFWLSPETFARRGTNAQEVAANGPPAALAGEPADVTVAGANGVHYRGRVEMSGNVVAFHVPDAKAPGIYRVQLPLALTGALAPLLDRDGMLPFAVRSSADEARLDALSRDQQEKLYTRLGAVRLDSADELLTAIRGGVPGQEIWRLLALLGFGLVLAETALVRWIARQRRGRDASAVRFAAQTGDVASHQAALWEKLRAK